MWRSLWLALALFAVACGGTSAPETAAAPGTPITGVVLSSVVGANPGGRASASVIAPPNTRCTITYTAPDGRIGRLPGLDPKTTDAGGRATWTWTIATTTAPGIGTVAVECGGVTRSERILIGVRQ